MEAKDEAVAGEAAQVFQFLIKLVHLNVLKLFNGINVPVGVADVVLAQRILNQVDLVLDLQRIHLRDDNDLTQLADQVFIVWQAQRWVIFILLVHLEVFVQFADNEGHNLFR